ncbi:histidine kinase dimerization/phospho-acceptor domain-containing protein [Streptomyces sp. NPDC058049]|uniref:histidine kinase dimerization/phospho-acceptor domain-containing protein n=1 Tax=Streptomyces sp. NPDC058049 TaxID=3346314 RepID=UPI0036EAA317
MGRQEPAPTPLRDAPEVGPQGLRAVDPVELARADPRMRPYLTGDSIEAPGRAGLRPAVQRDLTGDGQPDLIVAADTATGRSALSVCSVADGRIVSVLFTIGRQLAADAIGLRWKIAQLPGPLRAAALAGQRSTYLDMSGRDPVVWAARPIGGNHVLSVRQSLAGERAELTELDRRLVAYGASVVALAALGGALLASRLSRDLRTAAETARRISAGELDARIGPPGRPGTRDEVAELSSAVDTMAASLQRRLEAEQRFTADVAHELRTPLTGLHTAAELLPPGRPTELVRDRVAALRTLTEDLLEVARLDANREEPRWEAHPLGPLVESITRRSGVAAQVTGGRTPGSPAGVTRTARGAPMAAAPALTCEDIPQAGQRKAYLTEHQQARGGRAGFPRRHDPVSPGESPCADVPHTC